MTLPGIDEAFNILYTITLRATCVDSHHALDDSHHATDGHLDGLPSHGTDLCVRIADPDAPAGTFGDGEVCLGDLTHGQIVLRYQRSFGPFECGDHSFTNTVTVTDVPHEGHADGHVLDEDSATMNFHVLCGHGCTLTQGYWKTHSNQGPAPLDPTWNLLPLAELTAAFLPNVDAKPGAGNPAPGTWYSIFWTSPSGGNVYYQLAHQYMAAKLNRLGGASSTAAVDAAIASADVFFATYTPTEAGALGKNSTARQNALALATTLGNYNTGLIGPGHCDEAHSHVV